MGNSIITSHNVSPLLSAAKAHLQAKTPHRVLGNPAFICKGGSLHGQTYKVRFPVDDKSYTRKALLQGWQGVQTIPREVTYDGDSATLLFYPIEEVSLLRNDSLYSGTANLTFSPPSVNVSGTFAHYSYLPHSAPCSWSDSSPALLSAARLHARGLSRG